jgi:chromosome partitioning protein
VGVDEGSAKPGVYELISGLTALDKAIRQTPVPGLSVIPAGIDLSGAAVELIEQEERDFFLKKALEDLRARYDYILIDCPPSLGVLTLNGITAADAVLIPMQCEYFAMEGLSHLLQTIKRVQKGINPALDIGGIFFTMYDPRTRLAHQVVKEVGAYFKNKVFTTIIPRNVRLSEAPSHGLPISQYDPLCPGAKAYKSLTQEVLDRGA